MSKLIVAVKEITHLRKHPNADTLDVGMIGGWQVVVKSGQYKNGDQVVFIPPDAVLTEKVYTDFGVKNHLAEIKGTTNRRVKAARLRGEPSYGIVVDVPQFQFAEEAREFNEDIAFYWGITKWEPPVNTDGSIGNDHPVFHRYTDMERWQNFPNLIKDGETVVITEKIHGTNSRVGYIPDENGEYGFIVGSHSSVRVGTSVYSLPLGITSVVDALEILYQKHKQPIIIFGEIYGPGVQDMQYGVKPGHKGYRVFDISINGRYLSYPDKKAIATRTGLELVPLLYRGPLSAEIVQKYTDGFTTLGTFDKFAGREGIVITPEIEREDPVHGRVILKSISADYYARRNPTDSH